MFSARNLAPLQRPMKALIDNVGASTTMKVELAVGPTYLNTELEFKIGGRSGAAPSRANLAGGMLTRIRILLNGEPRLDMPMSEYVDKVEYYMGAVVGATGYLPIIQQMLWNFDPTQGGNPLAAAVNPAWGTKNHGALTVEIDTDATSTIDYVDVHCDIQPQQQDLGLHFRQVRLTPTFASTGLFQWQIPFRERGGALYAIHVKPPVLANLTYVRLFADGAPAVEGTVEQLHRRLLKAAWSRRTIQSGWCHLERCWRNYDQDALQWDILDEPLTLEMQFANAAPNTFPVHLDVASPDTRPPSAA